MPTDAVLVQNCDLPLDISLVLRVVFVGLLSFGPVVLLQGQLVVFIVLPSVCTVAGLGCRSPLVARSFPSPFSLAPNPPALLAAGKRTPQR